MELHLEPRRPRRSKRYLLFFVVIGISLASYHVWAARNEKTDGHADSTPAEEAAVAAVTEVPFNPNEFLPDLVPLPARDLKITRENDGLILLLFSTTYYNQGRGPLELRADPKTAGIRDDIERNVMQRVYLANDTYRDRVVGTFMWHQEHLHYHFSDFIEYDLEAVDAPGHANLSGSRVKSTFCIRDISKVHMDLEFRSEEVGYKICGKERQGVSVGWGDTYYFDYPAQNIDITDLASGTYRLTFKANPAQRIEELNYANNVASVVFTLNMENDTVIVREEVPKTTPEIEHIHLDKPFGINPE